MENLEHKNILPIWSLVKASYGYVYEHIPQYVAPILVIFFVNLGIHYSISTMAISSSTFAFSWVAALVVLLFAIPIMVGTHRMVLLNEVRSSLSFFRLDRNAIKYFVALSLLITLYVIGMFSPYYLLYFGVSIQALSILRLVIYLSSCVLIIRLGLSLPGIAIEAPRPLVQSWKSTDGSVLRLMLVIFLTLLPNLVIEAYLGNHQLLSMASEAQAHQSVSLIPALPYLALQCALTAIYIPISCVLSSLSYDVLVRGNSLGILAPLRVTSSDS
jgi:hypothetical protein